MKIKKSSIYSLITAGTKLYHTTLTKNVSKIKKKGLLPFQTSNWIEQGSKDRYGEGEIYAFENFMDAVRWASKMDWEFHQKMGSGKISIITIKKTGKWIIDKNDPLSQFGSKGKWLKHEGSISSENIVKINPVTLKETRRLVNEY